MIFGLSETDREKICGIFDSHPEIERVILYGSRAKGTYKPYSDIDLTLIGDLNLSKKWKIEWELDDLLLPNKMDISLYAQISNPDLIGHIDRVGKVFYQKGEAKTFSDYGG